MPLNTLVSPIHILIALLCASGLLTALVTPFMLIAFAWAKNWFFPSSSANIPPSPSLPLRMGKNSHLHFHKTETKGARLLSLSCRVRYFCSYGWNCAVHLTKKKARVYCVARYVRDLFIRHYPLRRRYSHLFIWLFFFPQYFLV